MWGVLSPVITRGPSSPFLLMWLFTPQAQGSSLAWIGHSDTSFPCSCWRPLPFPCGLQWGHSSFCSGLQGLLSGPGAFSWFWRGVLVAVVVSMAGAPRWEIRLRNTPVYQVPTTCPALPGQGFGKFEKASHSEHGGWVPLKSL